MNEKTFITEGLDFHDMEGQIDPVVTVDEYEAKMGEDSDIVTLAFTVKSEEAGNDLVDWFERGYDWVIDSSLSEGEIEVGKYLVFVELNRRSTVPARIMELLKDLKTLTALKPTEWTVQVNGEDYDADENVLKQVIITNPNVYKQENNSDKELNEMREIAGMQTKPTHKEQDEYIKNIKSMAGM